jgi:hypothetical protein
MGRPVRATDTRRQPAMRDMSAAAGRGDTVPNGIIQNLDERARQHHRVTNADRVLQDAVQRFHAEGVPVVRHLVAAQRSRRA